MRRLMKRCPKSLDKKRAADSYQLRKILQKYAAYPRNILCSVASHLRLIPQNHLLALDDLKH
ncbi:hypothetical protein ACVIHI_009057 [Bradyrhizobium sp. USDA 4524]|nr:hypothetical protein [Bradyrhizobium sp. USDA 4538]MCP1907202.1 hypothetical protein [Bradyrhizobium sp. USDA 4537]MCP1985678.1 hypothetical protein [Bradyrhizobium sp. USDA 4539]